MKAEDINVKELIEKEFNRQFNRGNKICCEFHKEKTPSLSYDPKRNRWKCFGCGLGGDSIDFIRELKGYNYIEACKYLGVEPNEFYKKIYSEEEKIKKYINWQLKNIDTFKDWQLIKIYRFENSNNETLYFKAKFKTPGAKQIRYYSINEIGDVKPKRLENEVPYNNYILTSALTNNKSIFIVEGEKDVDTLSYMGYKATSLKGIKEFDWGIFNNAKIYFVGDTGQAGEKYKHDTYNIMKGYVKEFNIIELPGIDELGDNADVTDWFKAGHTNEEFQYCIKDSWDWQKSTLWKYTKDIKRDNETVTVPLKVWQNLDLLLKREKIQLKYNVVSKEIEATGRISSTRNILLTDIKTLCQLNGFNLSKEDTKDYVEKIAKSNYYNPFLDYIKENENDNYSLITDLFECLNINEDFKENIDLYKTLFTKWLLNVVRTAHNTLQDEFESQGVLVIQGGQGAYKSTFCKNLLPNYNWFKGGKSLDPANKDSVKENTKYIIVELGELDSTLKGDQGKLKAFITMGSDEYRSPYATYEEKHPRLTTYCATVNKLDFLKDETGSRRFWIIPVEDCNIDKMKSIDINKMWGAVYSLYKSNTVNYWLDRDEAISLSNNNTGFNAESDISILIEERFDWDQNPIAWKVYTVLELCEALNINERKALKNEMLRRKLKYQSHRDNYSEKPKKGYKLPNLDLKEAAKIKTNEQIVIINMDDIPF